jgi:hypothetical protein
MRPGYKFGRIGFVVGFIGPILFYLVPYTFERHIFCPLCPQIDMASRRPLLWLEIGLGCGLAQGLTFALLGFVIGFLTSKSKY